MSEEPEPGYRQVSSFCHPPSRVPTSMATGLPSTPGNPPSREKREELIGYFTYISLLKEKPWSDVGLYYFPFRLINIFATVYIRYCLILLGAYFFTQASCNPIRAPPSTPGFGLNPSV